MSERLTLRELERAENLGMIIHGTWTVIVIRVMYTDVIIGLPVLAVGLGIFLRWLRFLSKENG